ncbi:MAG: hypothetical protein M1814_002358 [Vezdaea aestivalis]|nr:MAG: hypothetical protein M1814_002358 [Vezdaea aestivalis]
MLNPTATQRFYSTFALLRNLPKHDCHKRSISKRIPRHTLQYSQDAAHKCSITATNTGKEGLSTPSAPSIESETRTVLRQIPQVVGIVTAFEQLASDPGGCKISRGLTVSSLVSVSMSPPTLSFNIKRPSTTLTAILAQNQFLVHYLLADASGVEAAKVFVKPDPFQRARQVVDEQAGPCLRGGGIGAILACKLWKPPDSKAATVAVHDHDVVFGTVTEVLKKDMSSHALGYVGGQFVIQSYYPVTSNCI